MPKLMFVAALPANGKKAAINMIITLLLKGVRIMNHLMKAVSYNEDMPKDPQGDIMKVAKRQFSTVGNVPITLSGYTLTVHYGNGDQSYTVKNDKHFAESKPWTKGYIFVPQ